MDVYVMKDGQRRGPYRPFRLTEMLEAGELTPQDEVWHEGMDKWQPLGETESLRSVLRPAEKIPAPGPGAELEAPAATASAVSRLPEQLTLAVLRQRRALAWRRFFARQIDMTICATTIIVLAAFAGWIDLWSLYRPGSLSIVLAPALIWILLESVMLSLLGWTPGRLMLGLRVVNNDGNRPSPGAALKRSVLVWAGGMGFGLPADYLLAPLTLAQWIYAFWLFQQRGKTLWDHSAGTRVAFRPLHRGHAAGIAILTAAVTSLFAWICFTAPLPSRFSDEERAKWEKLRRAAWESAAPAPGNSGLPSATGHETWPHV